MDCNEIEKIKEFGILPSRCNLIEVIFEQKSITKLNELWGLMNKSEKKILKGFFTIRKEEILRGVKVL